MRYLIFIFFFQSTFALASWQSIYGNTDLDALTAECDSYVKSNVGDFPSRVDFPNCQFFNGPNPCPDNEAWNQSTESCDIQCPPNSFENNGVCSCFAGGFPDESGNCDENCSDGFPPADDGFGSKTCDRPTPCDDIFDPNCSPDPEPECPAGQVKNEFGQCVNTPDDPEPDDPEPDDPESDDPDSDDPDSDDPDSDDPDSDDPDSDDPDSEGGSGSGSGSGDEGSESSEQSNTASGGETCDSAPVCTGDEALCALLHQQWLTRCPNITEEVDTEPSEELTGFYEAEYPNGFSDIWSKRQPEIYATPLAQYAESWVVDVSAGEAPPLTICFDLGFTNYGCHEIKFDPRVFPFIRIIMIVMALFLARQLTLGG